MNERKSSYDYFRYNSKYFFAFLTFRNRNPLFILNSINELNIPVKQLSEIENLCEDLGAHLLLRIEDEEFLDIFSGKVLQLVIDEWAGSVDDAATYGRASLHYKK